MRGTGKSGPERDRCLEAERKKILLDGDMTSLGFLIFFFFFFGPISPGSGINEGVLRSGFDKKLGCYRQTYLYVNLAHAFTLVLLVGCAAHGGGTSCSFLSSLWGAGAAV